VQLSLSMLIGVIVTLIPIRIPEMLSHPISRHDVLQAAAISYRDWAGLATIERLTDVAKIELIVEIVIACIVVVLDNGLHSKERCYRWKQEY